MAEAGKIEIPVTFQMIDLYGLTNALVNLQQAFIALGKAVDKNTAATNKMGKNMSALTDQLDAAIETLGKETAGLQDVFDAQVAAQAALQSALDASKANEAADEVELQKALDALNAANAVIAGFQNPPANP